MPRFLCELLNAKLLESLWVQLKQLQSVLLAMTCVLHFFLPLFFSPSQCEALGLSVWWGDQIYCCQVLGFPAPAEGKDLSACNKEGCKREDGGRFNFLNRKAEQCILWSKIYFCIAYWSLMTLCIALHCLETPWLKWVGFERCGFFFFHLKVNSDVVFFTCSLDCGYFVCLLHCDDRVSV